MRSTRATKETELGTEVPWIRMAMSERRFAQLYGDTDLNPVLSPTNIHSDPEVARAEGLTQLIASGPDIAALIFRSMMEFFGEGWVVGGKAALTIARPTYTTDFITAKGYVKAKELVDGKVRLICEVWVENQHGEKKVVGTASGLVS